MVRMVVQHGECHQVDSVWRWVVVKLPQLWSLAPSVLLYASLPEVSTSNKDSGHESESIPEYTAEEEREDNRLWRTVVIGEQEQRIDMKVIEPYRRVISHGGSQALCESGRWGTGQPYFFLR